MEVAEVLQRLAIQPLRLIDEEGARLLGEGAAQEVVKLGRLPRRGAGQGESGEQLVADGTGCGAGQEGDPADLLLTGSGEPDPGVDGTGRPLRREARLTVPNIAAVWDVGRAADWRSSCAGWVCASCWLGGRCRGRSRRAHDRARNWNAGRADAQDEDKIAPQVGETGGGTVVEDGSGRPAHLRGQHLNRG